MRGFRYNYRPLRLPSAKNMALHFENPEIDISLLRRIFTLNITELEKLESVIRYKNNCYNPPNIYQMRQMAINACIGGHGVESAMDRDEQYADYINMGDTYNPTIVWYKGMCYFTTLGDFVEKRKQFDET